MSNNIINEGKKALERALLVMNYSLEKTLTENKETISEQTAMTDQEIEDRRIGNIISHASYGRGTDEDEIINGFSQIKNLDQFNRIDANYKKYNQEKGGSTYKSLAHLLQDELDTDDIETINNIKNVLSKIGVTVTYDKTLDDDSNEIVLIPSSIKLTPKSVVKQPVSVDTKCLSTLKSIGKNKLGCSVYKIGEKQYAFCSDGRGRELSDNSMRNWKCDGNKILYDNKVIYEPKKSQQDTKKQVVKTQTPKKEKQVVNQFKTNDEVKLTADQGL
jgi:hypothetical protein